MMETAGALAGGVEDEHTEVMMSEERGNRVREKVAIVTGAGSVADGIGNGRAAAMVLSRQGARLGLMDVNEEAAQTTARAIEAEGGECLVLPGDVTDVEACRKAVEATVNRWGRLDILVNNVGTSRIYGDATELDLDAWDRGMLINLKSMVMMVRFAVPAMRKSGGGSIINISSIAGIHGGHANLLYPTSKGAILNMTRAMADHHGPDGIRVNCIAPGFVYTPVIHSGNYQQEGLREKRRLAGALKTEGTAWDVAQGILYLASDDARWVTGIVLPIDAGASAISPHFKQVSPSAALCGHSSDWEAAAKGQFGDKSGS
jgi:NAD(P)-dependent dehydrogenase (short-subunit alcohol dehydrogenase family)